MFGLIHVIHTTSCDELRVCELVPEGNTLYYVAFVDRGGVRRIISLRLAERREVRKYVEHIQ